MLSKLFKNLAFVCSAKENDLMNEKGRMNGSIKKIMEGYTGGETVSFKSLAQEHCILENCETLQMRLLRHFWLFQGELWKMGGVRRLESAKQSHDFLKELKADYVEGL